MILGKNGPLSFGSRILVSRAALAPSALTQSTCEKSSVYCELQRCAVFHYKVTSPFKVERTAG